MKLNIKKTSNKVFGEKVTDKIPTFLIDSMEFIQNYGLKREGIFRISGDIKTIKQCHKRIDNG